MVPGIYAKESKEKAKDKETKEKEKDTRRRG